MGKLKFKEKIRLYASLLLYLICSLLLGALVMYILEYPEKKRVQEFRKELKREHKTIRAYVYWTNDSRCTIYYRFKLNGTTYKGKSGYIRLGGIWPERGDSINVYYSEKNPEINLWWWFCDGP